MLSRMLMVAALAVPMFADDYDNDRRWRRDDGRYSRDNDRVRRDRYPDYNYGSGNGNYGYGNNGSYSRAGSGILNQTMRDLQSAASRNRVSGHDRNHFNRAMSELQQISYRNQMDSGRLNRVLEDLDHLSRADQVHPRDRQILARDRQALESMAYNGGGYRPW